MCPDTDPAPHPNPGPTPTGYERTPKGSFVWQPPAPEELQDQFTHCQVLDLIGRGGMGAVYRGWQENLDRYVAIKILPRDLDESDPSFVERFKREAKTMASLSHPAIIAVHDAGETPSGLLYFVMEHVDGTDVFQMLQKQGRLKTKHALAIAAHVCDALQYAHSHGVVHRDIKPANIMVDSEGRVRVADFGLAKSLQANSGLTRTDISVGTPDYVAPEVLTIGMTPDHRADLYAVGVLLYQMLTGQVPRGNFELPSRLVSGLDPRFDAIVLRAMKTDPAQRFQSAAELRQALDEILAAPVIAAGGQNSAAIPKRALRPGLRWPLVGVAAVVMLGAAGFFLFKGGGKNEQGAVTQATLVAKALPPSGGETVAPSETSPKPAGASLPPAETPATPVANRLPGSGGETVAASELRPKPAAASLPLAEAPMTPPTPVPERKPEPAPPPTPAAQPEVTANISTPPPTRKEEKAPALEFPPGQWVKVFTKLEELPESLQHPDKGVKFEDGWMRITGNDRRCVIYMPAELGNNCAIRARILRGSTQEEFKGISLRSNSNPKCFYAVSLYSVFSCSRHQEEQYVLLFQIHPSVLPQPGEEYTLEFAAVGDRLVCRFNETFVRVMSDTTLPTGGAYISGAESVRDIEVMNLDGIPEAEALRILGVDEQGNDLFALAKKEDEKKKEQARQADAIAAILELKQLHEQFLKLQAERVTTVFEADLAKLNTGYLGGLDRAIADEKKAGRLDGVLALEEEKELVAGNQPLPGDEETTPANLKKLRGIYRGSLAKLEAARAANLKLLTDPLTVRLKQLESTLTQQNRVPDAKTVREYREGLAPSPDASDTGKDAPVAQGPRDLVLAQATKEKPFVNSLGMKFVPVKGTEVLFCIHETRYKDYAEYAKASPGIDPNWPTQTVDGFKPVDRAEEHPVAYMSREDAAAFCKWLSEKEKGTYRLPTDREWSVAVGLGRKEKWRRGDTPDSVEKDQNEFPWGTDWPPPKGAGNYSDQSRKAKLPTVYAGTSFIDGYDDGFPTTAPVMSFVPNEFGIFDMGGNVWEWVEDKLQSAMSSPSRVMRGASWVTGSRQAILSSTRNRDPGRNNNIGFRVVAEVADRP